MAYRKFSSTIKSLLHFDFPYYHEPNDGLHDEISDLNWARNGDVNFVGTALPNDKVVSNCPKFGYRCPEFSGVNSFISSENDGTFSLDANKNYEIEFFLRITANTAGRIFALKNSDSYSFVFALNDGLKFSLSGVESSAYAQLNTWTHILIKITDKKFYVFMDGSQIITGNFNGAECSQIELGGFYGQIDEFIFRHAARNSFTVPTEPYKGTLNISLLNSFGDKKYGTQEIKSAYVINSTGIISQASKNKITVPIIYEGKINTQNMAPTVNDEIMIHVSKAKGSNYSEIGKYAFRKITAINGQVYTLDKEISDEFNLSEILEDYYVQIITVPNFDSLTISNTGQISASAFNTNTGGGVIALRVLNNLTVNGKIISSGYGPIRTDNLQMTHGKLIDRFILNTGGGIFIAAKNFKAVSSARIGASYSGNGDSENGASGYGAKGSDNTFRYRNTSVYWGASGANGGVGGGGGAGGGSTTNSAHLGNGGAAGNPDRTGGGSGWAGSPTSGTGGAQGITEGGNGLSGGGGAGGSVLSGNVAVNHSGANVIILAEKFSCDSAALSTGGKFTQNFSGGGTGFAYIAAKELI